MKEELRIKSSDNASEIVVFNRRYDSHSQLSRGEFQRMEIRNFLREELKSNTLVVDYEPGGAPFIPSMPSLRISISHSGEWFAIQWSETKMVGVDIQIIKKELSEGKSYFVNEEELLRFEMSKLNLYIIWSAKEAIYKLKKGEIKDYKDSMVVNEIKEDSVLIAVEDELLRCSFQLKDDFLLLYTAN